MDVETKDSIARFRDEAARLSAAGHFDEAEKIYRQIVDTIRQHEGPEASYRELYNLSSTLVSQQKYDEAEPILRDALARLACRPIHGDSGHLLEQETGTLRLLFQTVRGQGRAEEADKMMAGASYSSQEEQLQVRKQVYGLTTP
jgi:tetratricopeptide (TPR) repeat protein